MMQMPDYIALLFMGIIICVCVAFIIFIDFSKIIYKIAHVKKPKDYEENLKLIKSPEYKRHKRRWILFFSLNAVIYAFAFFVTFIISKNTLLAMFLGMIFAACGFGIMSNKERKELERIKANK